MGFRASHTCTFMLPPLHWLLVISTLRAWRLEAERRPCFRRQRKCGCKSLSEFIW